MTTKTRTLKIPKPGAGDPIVAGDVATMEATLNQLRQQESDLAGQLRKTQNSVELYTRLLGYAQMAAAAANDPAKEA